MGPFSGNDWAILLEMMGQYSGNYGAIIVEMVGPYSENDIVSFNYQIYRG